MASKIKGITIEIGGNTVGLDKALGEVNKKSRNLQTELRQVERLLKLDPKNTELLAQKQKLLSESVATTGEKLDSLREAEKQVQRQFEKGEVSEEQYRALQREIVSTEQKLKGLESQTQKAGSKFDWLGGKATKFNGFMKKVTAGIAGVGAGLLGMAYKAGVSADNLNTLSKTTGIGTEQLQKFQYASDRIDVSVDTLAKSMSRLTKGMGDTMKGTGSAKDAFSALGIEITDQNGRLRDNQDVFDEAILRLSEIENATERDAIAMDLFGKSAQDLNPLILGGAESLKVLGEEAEQAGVIMSQEALDGANAFNDSIDTLKAQATGIFSKLGGEIATSLTPKLSEIVEKVGELIRWILDNKTQVLTALVAMASALVAFNIVVILQGLVKGFQAFKLAQQGATVAQYALNLAMSLNPIGILVALIAGLVATILVLWNTNEDFRNFITECWELICAVVQARVEEIKTFFTETLPQAFSAFLEWIDTFFITDWTTKFGILGLIINYFRDGIKAHFTAIQGIFGNIISFVKNVFTGNWSGAWQNVVDIFGNIFSLIKDLAQAPIAFVTGLIDGVVESVKKAIEWLTKLGKKKDEVDEDDDRRSNSSSSSRSLRMMAKGGVLSNGEAIVAEAGPELIQMINGKAVVTPLTNSARNTAVHTEARSGSLGGDLTVNVYSPKALTAPEAARYFKRAQRETVLGVR